MRKSLTRVEITKVAHGYVGVHGGYLGDFSYATHADFYPLFCGLEINPYALEGTTRERFMEILRRVEPHEQAAILRGVLEKYPPGSEPQRTEARADELRRWAVELEQASAFVDASAVLPTSDAVERALKDAETMISERGSTSGVDRAITALHGYLRSVCDGASIAYTQDPSITELFKAIRASHPAFAAIGLHRSHLAKVGNSLAAVIDALQPIRNRASLAHPNEHLLDEPEATLAINSARTLLVYTDTRVKTWTSAVPRAVASTNA